MQTTTKRGSDQNNEHDRQKRKEPKHKQTKAERMKENNEKSRV